VFTCLYISKKEKWVKLNTTTEKSPKLHVHTPYFPPPGQEGRSPNLHPHPEISVTARLHSSLAAPPYPNSKKSFPKLQTLDLATRVDSGCRLWVAIPYPHSTWWRESRRQAVRARHSPRLRASEQPSGQHTRRPTGRGELLCFLQFVSLDLVSWLIGESLVKWNENSLILSVN
jgi:hypothetical protein